MAPATVYKILRRFLDAGAVEKIAADDGEARMSCRYALTERGIIKLKIEVERLETVSKYARYKLSTIKEFAK